MECKNCELTKRHFICKNCLRDHQRDRRLQITGFSTDLDEQKQKVIKALEQIAPNRVRRATLASLESRVDEIAKGLQGALNDCDAKRKRLQELRENIAQRRRTLAEAKLFSAGPQINNPGQIISALSSLHSSLASARSALVSELVEVFNIVEVGGRPPVGGKAGTKGEWTIGGLILPVPGDIRRYPPDHMNAVITHTIHFLSLLTFYLGIKLPFQITWDPPPDSASGTATKGKLGVGTPWIVATRGAETGGWARYTTPQPLHLSSAPPTSPQPSQSTFPPAISMSESFIEHSPPSGTPKHSFSLALSMLIYNVTYVAYTQGLTVPLSQAGDILSTLWCIACSGNCGARSHSTGSAYLTSLSNNSSAHPPLQLKSLLAEPTPPEFGVDFGKVVMAMSTNPSRTGRVANFSRTTRTISSGARPKTREEKIDEEGWDLVEDDSFGSL